MATSLKTYNVYTYNEYMIKTVIDLNLERNLMCIVL